MALVMFVIIAKNRGNQRERQILKEMKPNTNSWLLIHVVQDIANYVNIKQK